MYPTAAAAAAAGDDGDDQPGFQRPLTWNLQLQYINQTAAAAAAAGDDGDDQPGFQRPLTWNLQLLLGAVGTFFIAALCDAGMLCNMLLCALLDV
jgi:hypothetical protein